MAEDLFEPVGSAAQSRLAELTDDPHSSNPAEPATYHELDLGSSLPLATLELASEAVVSRLNREAPPALVPMSLPALSLRPPVRFTVRDFAAPVVAICAGVGLSMLGEHYALTSGQVFSVGPLRLVWVTVPMVVLGAALVVVRLLQRRAQR